MCCVQVGVMLGLHFVEAGVVTSDYVTRQCQQLVQLMLPSAIKDLGAVQQYLTITCSIVV